MAAFKQILRRCSSLGRSATMVSGSQVPKGHFAVYVGENRSRFVVPISFLATLEFQNFLQSAEDVFRYDYETAITIPFDEIVFQCLVPALH